MEESNPPIKQEPIEEFVVPAQEPLKKNQTKIVSSDKRTTPLRSPPGKIKLEPQIASIHDWLSKLPASKPVVEKSIGAAIDDASLDEPDGGMEANTLTAIPKSASKTKQTAIRTIPTNHRKTTAKVKPRKTLQKSVKKSNTGKGKEVDRSSSSVNEGNVRTTERKVTNVKKRKVDCREPTTVLAGPSTPRKRRIENDKGSKELEEPRMLDESEYSDEILEKKKEFQSLLELFDQKALDAYDAYEDLAKELSNSVPDLKIIIETPRMYNKHAIYALMGLNEGGDPKKVFLKRKKKEAAETITPVPTNLRRSQRMMNKISH